MRRLCPPPPVSASLRSRTFPSLTLTPPRRRRELAHVRHRAIARMGVGSGPSALVQAPAPCPVPGFPLAQEHFQRRHFGAESQRSAVVLAVTLAGSAGLVPRPIDNPHGTRHDGATEGSGRRARERLFPIKDRLNAVPLPRQITGAAVGRPIRCELGYLSEWSGQGERNPACCQARQSGNTLSLLLVCDVQRPQLPQRLVL